jgi:outer membrane protein assembly factor BamE (lipoprotein component of BamABCDE complex)
MATSFTVILLIALIATWYFWKKSPNKKYRNVSIAIAIISFFVVGYFGKDSTAKPNKSVETEKVSTSKQSRFSNIKLGMTKKEVIKELGKPDFQTSRNLTYGKKDIYLVDNKVIGGNYKSLQKQVDKKNAEKKEKQEQLKGSAQVFGKRSTKHLESMPSAYKKIPLDTGETMYSWKTDYGLLVRVDSADGATTKVYKYDKKADDGLGELLFTGQN